MAFPIATDDPKRNVAAQFGEHLERHRNQPDIVTMLIGQMLETSGMTASRRNERDNSRECDFRFEDGSTLEWTQKGDAAPQWTIIKPGRRT